MREDRRKEDQNDRLIVFSSAGIGRTGVLILMETALCLIETNQPVFPLDIVRQMREQRLGMIQTAVSSFVQRSMSLVFSPFQSQYQYACGAVLYAYDQHLVQVNSK